MFFFEVTTLGPSEARNRRSRVPRNYTVQCRCEQCHRHVPGCHVVAMWFAMRFAVRFAMRCAMRLPSGRRGTCGLPCGVACGCHVVCHAVSMLLPCGLPCGFPCGCHTVCHVVCHMVCHAVAMPFKLAMPLPCRCPNKKKRAILAMSFHRSLGIEAPAWRRRAQGVTSACPCHPCRPCHPCHPCHESHPRHPCPPHVHRPGCGSSSSAPRVSRSARSRETLSCSKVVWTALGN